MLYKIIFLFFFFVFSIYGKAQPINPSVIATTGGNISNSINTLTWTLGETVIQNIQSSNNYLSQGFQQPNYMVIPSVENTTSLFDVKVFPNPSVDILNIIINSDNEFLIEIILTDINGKTLFWKKDNTSAKQHTFIYDISSLATASYFLKITNTKENISETFKIQKVH